MSLNPLRQVFGLNVDFITLNTSERGGILTLANVSGIDVAQYSEDPAGRVPMGLQVNDVEHRDESRQTSVYSLPRRVEIPCGIVGIYTDGEFETDWIFPSGAIFPGYKAYVGPSGMVTNVSSFGGVQIGHFLTPLMPDRHLVTFKGLGFSREQVDPITKQIFIENDPVDRVLLVSEGFIRLRLNQSIMIKSASELGL